MKAFRARVKRVFILAPMSKQSTAFVVLSVVKRFLLPWHLWRVVSLQRNRKKTQRVFDDAQLKLYSQLLPGGFLHYGYFDNPEVEPMEISINDIYRAQKRYAEILLEKLPALSGLKVLDIGCGMGAMSKMMLDEGHLPEALTPDNTQAHYIREHYPNIPLHHCKFEDFESAHHIAEYDVVITSESLQYLKQDIALPKIDKVLKPGGKWIACDYFRVQQAHEKSGHFFDEFQKNLQKNGLKITAQRNITPNILPTIAFVYQFANRIGLPLLQFGIEKLETKAPGIHYAVQEVIPFVQGKIDKNLLTVNPEIFAMQKQYLLMEIERA